MFVSECLTAGTGNCVSWRWSFCRTATFVYTWLQCWLSRKKRKEEWGADYDAASPLENHSRWGKYKIIRTIYERISLASDKWQILQWTQLRITFVCCLHHVRRVFEDSFRWDRNRRLVLEPELDGNWRFLSRNDRGRASWWFVLIRDFPIAGATRDKNDYEIGHSETWE